MISNEPTPEEMETTLILLGWIRFADTYPKWIAPDRRQHSTQWGLTQLWPLNLAYYEAIK